LSKDNCTCTH